MPLSCEVVDNGSFFGARLVGGRDTPDFGHAFSNRTHFRACGLFWMSSGKRAARVADEKKERRRRICGKESVVKVRRHLCPGPAAL